MQTELSFSLIFNQTLNFAKNRLWQIIVVSVILGILNVSITNYFMDQETIEQLSYATDVSFVFSAMSQMIGIMAITSLIVTCLCIATVYNLSVSNKFNANLLLSRTLSNLLKVLGFNVIYTFILFFAVIILGLVLFVIKLILPSLGSALLVAAGLFLMIFMMTIYNFFIGAIVEPSSKTFIELFTESHQFAKQYWKLGILMIIINVMCLVIIVAFAMTATEENLAIDIVLSSLSHFIDIFVICFFYRLYLLISNKEPKTIDNSDKQNNLII